MAYHTGNMAENLCVLPRVYVIPGQTVESVWKKTLWEIYNKTRNFSNGSFPSLAVQWIMAWPQMELHFLWNVLFCRFDGGDRGGANPGLVS